VRIEDKELDSNPYKIQIENITGSLSERNLRTRLRTFPKDAQSWFLLGKLLRTGEKLKPAEDALRKAISINPAPPHFWLELARVLDDLGIDSEATNIRHQLVEKAKVLDLSSLKATIEASKTKDSLVAVSPCISCSHYTYYGCNKRDQCSELREWRSSVLHPK
jgi:predicted Zn-dependent protease